MRTAPEALHQISRRSLLAAGAGSLIAAAMPVSVRAQSGELIIANWGGDWNERVVRAFEKPLLGSTGIKIIHDLAPAPERKAKLLAERKLPRGTIDIAWLSDADAYEMNAQGVLDPIDFSRIANAKFIDEKVRSPHLVTAIYGGIVMMYNPTRIATPPTSFTDLWNEKLAGRVGLMDQLYFQYIYAASVSHGGRMSEVDKAFPALLDLKKAVKPRLYPSHQALAAAFASEEIWISANYNARIIQWMKEGLPVKWSYPKEGAIFTSFGAGVPKRGKNRDAAYVYLNAMLDPQAMGGISEATSYAASTTNATMSEDTRAQLSFSAEQIQKLNFVDYEYAAKNDSKWVDWWNKEFKA
jgi:putative spermidine/putrescine transport system substrate-binding protein